MSKDYFSDEEVAKIINDEEFKKFVPPEGQQYSMLEWLTKEEIAKLPPEIKQFYEEKEIFPKKTDEH